MNPTLLNVRLGFATNSSSSHSIVMMNTGDLEDTIFDESHYGWDDFTLVSKEAKSHYIGSMLSADYTGPLPEFIKDLLNGSPPADIDHQSVIYFPKTIKGKPSKKFFHDFLEHIIENNRIVILGGSDDSDPHPLRSRSVPISFLYNYDIGRKDRNTGIWTLMDKQQGTKIRLSASRTDVPLGPFYSPELVDIKITDYCPFNCSFCYQGSTPSGRHADPKTVDDLADALLDLEVFEVAIGGGEPTLHPNFHNICKSFSDRGITVCVTTADLNNLEKNMEKNPNVSAWGVSIWDENSIEKLNKVEQDKFNFTPTRDIYIHLVMGTLPIDTINKIISKSQDRVVVLLGYKSQVGRGGAGPTYQYHSRTDIDSIINPGIANISIDTCLATEWDHVLKESVSSLFYSVKDTGSAYIDAVSMMMALDSYTPGQQFVNIQPDLDNIARAYAILNGVK